MPTAEITTFPGSVVGPADAATGGVGKAGAAAVDATEEATDAVVAAPDCAVWPPSLERRCSRPYSTRTTTASRAAFANMGARDFAGSCVRAEAAAPETIGRA